MSRGTGFIQFDIVGNQQGVQQMLDAVDSALSSTGLAAFFELNVGPWVQQRAQSRFEREGDDASGKWAPLQEATIEFREHAGFEGPHPINKRTGELEDYIAQEQIGIVTSPGVGVMTYPKDKPKSKALKEKLSTAQQGRKTPSTVPRPVLALSERDLSQVLVMLAFHVQKVGRVLGAGN